MLDRLAQSVRMHVANRVSNTMCAQAALAQRPVSRSLARLERAPVRAPAQFGQRTRFVFCVISCELP